MAHIFAWLGAKGEKKGKNSHKNQPVPRQTKAEVI